MKIGDVEDNIKDLKKHSIKDWLVLISIVLLIVCLGLWGVNGLAQFKYNTELLSSPCGLCEELNPHLELCEVEPTSDYFAIKQ